MVRASGVPKAVLDRRSEKRMIDFMFFSFPFKRSKNHEKGRQKDQIGQKGNGDRNRRKDPKVCHCLISRESENQKSRRENDTGKENRLTDLSKGFPNRFKTRKPSE